MNRSALMNSILPSDVLSTVGGGALECYDNYEFSVGAPGGGTWPGVRIVRQGVSGAARAVA